MTVAEQDITLGEIGRSVDRIEATVNNLAMQVQAVVSLTTAHNIKLDVESRRADELERKVESLNSRSAYISGGIAVIAAGINFLIGRR